MDGGMGWTKVAEMVDEVNIYFNFSVDNFIEIVR